MTLRRFKLWTAWLLPLIVLRAFVPVGYMVAAGVDGLALTLCSDAIVLSTAAEHLTHAEHHHEGSEHAHHLSGADGSGALDSAPCPYALAASAPMPAMTWEAWTAFVRAIESATSFQAFIATRRASTAHSIRGPPAHS